MNKDLCDKKDCWNKGGYGRRCGHLNYTVPAASKIEKVSDKKKDLDKKYTKIRGAFLKSHPFCQANIEGCSKVSTDIHHKKGKIGEEDYLNDKYFLAVCRKCHTKIEASPAWAKQQGFSISRHANLNPNY